MLCVADFESLTLTGPLKKGAKYKPLVENIRKLIESMNRAK